LALGVGWLAWKRFDTMEQIIISNRVLGSITPGGTGVAFGVYGTLLIYPRNEQAILGLFNRFSGIILSAILGMIAAKR